MNSWQNYEIRYSKDVNFYFANIPIFDPIKSDNYLLKLTTLLENILFDSQNNSIVIPDHKNELNLPDGYLLRFKNYISELKDEPKIILYQNKPIENLVMSLFR